MLTTKRVITDDDRQGGYTTTLDERAPVFNFSSRAPQPQGRTAEYSDYELERIEAMRTRAPVGARTETPFQDRTVRRGPYTPAAPGRTYSEEDLMPSIQTMRSVSGVSKAKKAAVAKRIERDTVKSEKAENAAEKKGLSQNAKLLIAVYAVIVFIALVLIIASGVAVGRQADKVQDLAGDAAKIQSEVLAQEQQIVYFTPAVPSADYVPADDANAKTFVVKPLSEQTEYKAQTNAFDKFLDFFSWLLGG